MPEGLPQAEIELLRAFEDHLALERRLSSNTVAAYGVDLQQLATFLTEESLVPRRGPVSAPPAVPRAAAHAGLRTGDHRSPRGCDQDVLPVGGLRGAYGA